MCHKINKILAALAITGCTLFQANGCDVATQAFIEGFENGYYGETGESLFDFDWPDTTNSDDTGYYGC